MFVQNMKFDRSSGLHSHDTHTCIFVLYSLFQQYKKMEKTLCVCFLDVTNTFDYINRNALIYKLFKRNVSGIFLIKSMFWKWKTRVNWGKDFSMPFKSCFGVIQGDVVSPQLFKEILSDLSDYLDPECGVKLDKKLFPHLSFADDLILFSHSAKSL